MTATATECSICMEAITTSSDIIRLNGDAVCESCFSTSIKPLFDKALRFEFCYPVHWGSEEISPSDFSRLLPDGFLQRWEQREKEYKTPQSNRLYCSNRTLPRATVIKALDSENLSGLNGYADVCGAFLGPKTPISSPQISCTACKGKVCGVCAGPIVGNDHSCSDISSTDSADDAFDGLVKGRDWQFCPSADCHMKLSLKDGCNHIVCRRCRTHFCFVCGEKATPGHWTKGKPCPRWNHPDAENAMYDEHDNAYPGDFNDANIPRLGQHVNVPIAIPRDGIVFEQFDDAFAGEQIARLREEQRAILDRLRRAEGALRAVEDDEMQDQIGMVPRIEQPENAFFEPRAALINQNRRRVHDLDMQEAHHELRDVQAQLLVQEHRIALVRNREAPGPVPQALPPEGAQIEHRDQVQEAQDRQERLERLEPMYLPATHPTTIRIQQELADIRNIVQDVWRLRAEAANPPIWTGTLIAFLAMLKANLRTEKIDEERTSLETVHRHQADARRRVEQMMRMAPAMAPALQRYPRLREITRDRVAI